ncbi:MAG TPA: GNAT family N-acetyltransferase [Candidatus Limnocylindria bacterium]|nr:GNAT family N-acetyltransferase [Candidatus Limnocylindria bacterium]
MSSPGLHADRLWVAREGQAIVGMSVLEYPPGVGNVWTDYTGTARSVRGRGVAGALKCETVAQAIALGVKHVRTNNDGENKPNLHLNEDMGYERIRGHIQLLKRVVEGAAA